MAIGREGGRFDFMFVYDDGCVVVLIAGNVVVALVDEEVVGVFVTREVLIMVLSERGVVMMFW